MKLKIRALTNDECEVDVDTSDSIRLVKTKVQEKFPSMDASRQKLIHAGKILVDEMKISDYPNINENDKLVVMVTKAAKPPASAQTVPAPPPPPPSLSSSSDMASSTPFLSLPSDSVESAMPPDMAQTNIPPPPPRSSSAEEASGTAGPVGESYASAASALLTGTQLEETISNISSMGFARDQVQLAMRAAFNNPDRAVEYLMTGIPQRLQHHIPVPAPQTAVQETDRTPDISALPQTDAAGGSPVNPLEALTRHPHFDEIRRLLQSNPAMVPAVVQNISEQNPTLGQIITNNPDAFMALVNQPGSHETARAAGPPTTTITLTEAEMESINRLQGLGFPRGAVEEAYLACERNEEMAANYLFENAMDLAGGPDEASSGEGGEND